MKVGESISNNIKVLRRLLVDRMGNTTYSELAKKYLITDTTARYFCEKYDVVPFDSRTIREVLKHPRKSRYLKRVVGEPLAPPEKKFNKYAYLIYEHVNEGKNYVDYLRDAGIKVKNDDGM